MREGEIPGSVPVVSRAFQQEFDPSQQHPPEHTFGRKIRQFSLDPVQEGSELLVVAGFADVPVHEVGDQIGRIAGGVADDRIRIDGEPPGPSTGQDIAAVEVAMEHAESRHARGQPLRSIDTGGLQPSWEGWAAVRPPEMETFGQPLGPVTG